MSSSECLQNNIKLSSLTVMGYFIKDYIEYIRENMQVLKWIRIKMNWKHVNSKLIGIWELIPSPIFSFTKTSRLFDICLVIVRMLAPFSLKRKTTLYLNLMYMATTAWQTKQKMMIHIFSGAFQSWNAEGRKARSQSTATGASPGLCICLPAMSSSKPPGLTNDWISFQKPCKHWMEETQNHLLVSKLDYEFHEQVSQSFTVISQHLWAFDWSSDV